MWTKCEDCDEYWCEDHEEHAHDCDCPPVEVWAEVGLNPYDHDLHELCIAIAKSGQCLTELGAGAELVPMPADHRMRGAPDGVTVH